MENLLVPPSQVTFFHMPGFLFALAIPVIAISIFTYMMAIRLAPLVRAKADYRFNRIGDRIRKVAILWLGQYRHPRYPLAGILHIMIFSGFIILSIRSFSMIMIGISDDFILAGFSGPMGKFYSIIKDYATTWVFIAVLISIIRRSFYVPKRYMVPERYGKNHTVEAIFILCVILLLLITESLFDASLNSAQIKLSMEYSFAPPLTLVAFLTKVISDISLENLQRIHTASYFIHDIAFFSFLCFLPLGKHFHVLTSLFNVFLMRLDKGIVKPVRYDIIEDQMDQLDSFGVRKMEDLTWKHLLDFYSCADCGRCSDQCPANTVGRPLSPRFITLKGRDKIFKNYPLFPYAAQFLKSRNLVGDIYDEDEIWSCTTCGACEEECPLCIEYIDKIVDLRRAMVEDGNVPQSLQKPLGFLQKRGNPWGKMEKKRAEWAVALQSSVSVKILNRKSHADTLYFVDSISSYDDRMQQIATSTSNVLNVAGVDFGILGAVEKDSGNEVRRFGEEMLFQHLRDHNKEKINELDICSIVASDPHAFNTLKNEYQLNIPVEHISQLILRKLKDNKIKLLPCSDRGKVYTYHDPCYLGRHNDEYEAPRSLIQSINGLSYVEMKRSRDRSFCCGGGGLMLFYEPKEDSRMGVYRVRMAADAGANVIVTACPFCLANIEDAIKVAGFDGKIEAIDLMELVSRHIKE